MWLLPCTQISKEASSCLTSCSSQNITLGTCALACTPRRLVCETGTRTPWDSSLLISRERQQNLLRGRPPGQVTHVLEVDEIR